MRFYMYKTIKAESVYHSSLSSDLAYYTNDALINIDAKSIDIESNSQDENKVTIEKNQISFQNKPVYSVIFSQDLNILQDYLQLIRLRVYLL